jgi:hypothetical protein
MAAQSKDGGRYPADKKIAADQFARFVADCKNPPAPPPMLLRLMADAAKQNAG